LSVPVQVIAWRTASKMTYKVSSGTLNLTHSLISSLVGLSSVISNSGRENKDSSTWPNCSTASLDVNVWSFKPHFTRFNHHQNHDSCQWMWQCGRVYFTADCL